MNRQIVLNERPVGFPTADTWHLLEVPEKKLREGEVNVKNIYASIDPTMRGWVSERKSYLPPVEIGAVMRALTVGEVVSTKHPGFQVGDYVHGPGGIQDFSISNGEIWRKIESTSIPLEKYLSILGMTGLTAYFGLLDIGKPKEGETILVSGAGGAVGSIVGQIGKIMGCRMVGIAGGAEKCKRLISHYGYDAAIDYKSENVWSALKKTCPEGIDIYFDNVGGEVLDMALAKLKLKGRIVLCGAISQYNADKNQGPANYMSLVINRGRMEGFLVMDYAKEYRKAATEIAGWMREGKLISDEHIEIGIENFFPAFQKLFTGNKRGKLILQINPPTS
ncbi:MAG: NADP-dependent oxidoreductase [Saprospiraceae bacterium]|nr:NADP-dependent oxidoreductase [Saprospiraceae bacterium]